jgi:hypothetical protein
MSNKEMSPTHYLFTHTYLEITRQAMYVQHNTEVRSCNHCWSGKAVSVTFCECVCVCVCVCVCSLSSLREKKYRWSQIKDGR